MTTLPLTKPYDEAADGMAPHIKECIRTDGVSERGQAFITLEGTYETLDTYELDMWGGHLRFTFLDTAPTDDDRAERGELAMAIPALAHYFTSTAQLLVERRETITTITVTTKRNARGRTISETKEETTEDEWSDVTEQFHKVHQRQAQLGW